MIAAFFLVNGIAALVGLIVFPIYLIAKDWFCDWRDVRALKETQQRHARLLTRCRRYRDEGAEIPDELRHDLQCTRSRYNQLTARLGRDYEESYPIEHDWSL